MNDKVKLNLAVATTPRSDTQQNKDSLLQNLYVDKSKGGQQFVVKRPGFLVATEAITTGLNRGIYWNPNESAELPDAGIGFWYVGTPGGGVGGSNLYGYAMSYRPYNPNDSYDINDGVTYDDGTGEKTYYSAIDNNTTPPSSTTEPGSIYWSQTPFPSTRYYGMYAGVTGPTTASKNSAGYTAYLLGEPNQTCATRNMGTGTYRLFGGVANVSSPAIVDAILQIAVVAATGPPLNCNFFTFPAAYRDVNSRVVTL